MTASKSKSRLKMKFETVVRPVAAAHPKRLPGWARTGVPPLLAGLIPGEAGLDVLV
jgi:hypothetical protein